MERLLYITAGGAFGTAARYLLAGCVLRVLGPAFHYGTLAVNLIGSFLLAGVIQAALTTESISPTLRLALTTGALGGFTTFSTFSYETLKLMQDGADGLAALNVTVSIIGCLVVSFAGFTAARWLVGS